MKEFSHAVRSHWPIETQLHWHLVTFSEDSFESQKEQLAAEPELAQKDRFATAKDRRLEQDRPEKKMFIAALNPAKLLELLFCEK